MDEDGDWQFTLPGFATFTQELANNYATLDGSKITIPVVPVPEVVPETEEVYEE